MAFSPTNDVRGYFRCRRAAQAKARRADARQLLALAHQRTGRPRHAKLADGRTVRLGIV